MYTAYETRASSGSTDNSPIVEKIMSLRQEQAQLAGYNSAADYLMSNKVPHLPFLCYVLMVLRRAQRKDRTSVRLSSVEPYSGDDFTERRINVLRRWRHL